jgi:hypothetical protein
MIKILHRKFKYLDLLKREKWVNSQRNNLNKNKIKRKKIMSIIMILNMRIITIIII